MKTLSYIPWGLITLTQTVLANVEKTIFLGPDVISIPLGHPTLEDLRLDTLTPENWSLRTKLSAKFPSPPNPKGDTTWLLLDNLQPGQRYEVRICWAAIQPTSFTLETYPLSTVFDTPELITSLNSYSTPRQPNPDDIKSPNNNDINKPQVERQSSILFLQILAAADYFTTNTTLMNHPPLVDADIILDPFLFNVLPRSLLPTVGYIIVVAAISLLLSRWIAAQLKGIVASGTASQQKKKQ